MDFHTLLKQHAKAFPEKLAFQDQDRAISYTELTTEVDRLAAWMQRNGAQRGQRLALWMPNCIEWLVTYLASARLGLTVVAVNTRFREHEVGQLLQRGHCTWLAVWPAFKGLPFVEILTKIEPALMSSLKGIIGVGDCDSLQGLLGGVLPDLALLPYGGEAGQGHTTIHHPGQGVDGALVYTTSGTTSAPKLVLHRQEGLLRHAEIASKAYGVGDDSVVLVAAPLCGAFGFSTFLSGLAQGATLVSLPVFDAALTVRQIQELGVTHTFANNELVNLLLREVQDQQQPFPSLQYLGFASFAPSMDDLPERALAAGIPIAGLYGSSELQALVAGHTLDTEWQHRRAAGGTLASPDSRVRAMDAETGQALPHGQVGQIEIKAPSIMYEYLDNPEATRKAFSDDGYFRTGDLGYTLNERSFVFQGRDGEHLRLSGFLVNPMEIEQCIEALPGVQAAQVVGAEREGKTVAVAFVIAEQGAQVSEQAIIASSKATMARFKVPERVVFVDAFPMVQSANSNKVQKHLLRKMAQELFLLA